MRSFTTKVGLVLIALYALIQIVLGSSPVQKWVLNEVRNVLWKEGLDLRIESIEFSALSPKLYLNHVTVSPNAFLPITLKEPIVIDKVKVEFQPLALIYKEIALREIVLLHPRIFLPKADEFYKKLQRFVDKKQPAKSSQGGFALVVKRIGIVDALYQVSVTEPKLRLASRSFTAFLTRGSRDQQNVTIESANLEIEYEDLKASLSKIDIDVDFTPNSLRLNRAVIEGQDMAFNIKGATSLPLKSGFEIPGPESLSLSYELHIKLLWLSNLLGKKAPALVGTIDSSGTVKRSEGSYDGEGKADYQDVKVDGYQVGSGKLNYTLNGKSATLRDLDLRYGGGSLTSPKVNLGLSGRFPISGQFALKGVRLEGILEAVKSPSKPVRMAVDGNAKLTGFLNGPFELNPIIEAGFRDLFVIEDDKKPTSPDNTIIRGGNGTINGSLKFFEDRFEFAGKVGVLDGTAETTGFLTYENVSKIKVHGEKLSLTKIQKISTLPIGGVTDLDAEIEVHGKDARIGGSFKVNGGEISDIVIGTVKGDIYFRNALLSFENLEAVASEPVRGSGFVDFRPDPIQYKFSVDIRRARIDQLFGIFQKTQLPFPAPFGGEGEAKVMIQGGHDSRGVAIGITGNARNFTFYDEKWNSATFELDYRPDGVRMPRAIFMKRSGALEVKGHFAKPNSSLEFRSRGLRLEEMDFFGASPLAGEIRGWLKFEGLFDGGIPEKGEGELGLAKVTFRGQELSDVRLLVHSSSKGLDMEGNWGAEGLTAHYFRGAGQSEDELNINAREFDLLPVVTLWLRRDIATISELPMTGELDLSGQLRGWKGVRGNGRIDSLLVGLKGTPLRLEKPIDLKVAHGAFRVERFDLVGTDSLITGNFYYEPDHSIQAKLDAKIDLQYLQPFIPGLDYGVGKVTAGGQLSGHPSSFNLLGNITISDSTARLTGLSDEFKNIKARLSLSQDRLTVDRFETAVQDGTLKVGGEIAIDRFTTFRPNLKLNANRVTLRTRGILSTTFSGDLFIRGDDPPWLLGGRCQLLRGALTSFEVPPVPPADVTKPVLQFDVSCEAKDKLLVKNEMMDAEFRGNLKLLGNTSQVGVVGTLELVKGTLNFRDTRFNLNTGNVKFESPTKIIPRFNIAGRAMVKEEKAQAPQQYEVFLQSIGTPEDYKIRLTSSPALTENEIISLLVLGVTNRGQEGNYLDLGSTIVGQLPLQSKIQSGLGVDIKVKQQPTKGTSAGSVSGAADTPSGTINSVPTVRLEKGITNKTKLSYSNSLDPLVPSWEGGVHHELGDGLSVNITAGSNARGSTATQSTQSYGLDIRKQFTFE